MAMELCSMLQNSKLRKKNNKFREIIVCLITVINTDKYCKNNKSIIHTSYFIEKKMLIKKALTDDINVKLLK